MAETIVADLKDYPPRLRRNAAVELLARALYIGRCETYGYPECWTTMASSIRDEYRAKALAWLERERPEPRGANIGPRDN